MIITIFAIFLKKSSKGHKLIGKLGSLPILRGPGFEPAFMRSRYIYCGKRMETQLNEVQNWSFVATLQQPFYVFLQKSSTFGSPFWLHKIWCVARIKWFIPRIYKRVVDLIPPSPQICYGATVRVACHTTEQHASEPVKTIMSFGDTLQERPCRYKIDT